MTAGIGVFNKHAAVLAADSAGTIGSGRKVYNNANKIFELNHNEKVGLLIYNSSTWFGIPMELIIDLYKKKETRNFNKLEEYVEDFENFLIQDVAPILNSDEYENYVEKELFYSFTEFTTKNHKEFLENQEGAIPSLSDYLKIELEKDYNEDLVLDIKFKDFEKSYKKDLLPLIRGFFSFIDVEYSSEIANDFFKLFYIYSVSAFYDDDFYIGLVFAGYGIQEIFPSVFEIRFSGIICNKLKYYVRGHSEINHSITSSIAPFAQREMVETFMEGINPDLENKYMDAIINMFTDLENLLHEKFNIEKDEIYKILAKKLVELNDEWNEIKDINMVQPIIETISLLKKDYLIEIAESLIGITSLKRKTSLEIETVGGPVDVALITKTDGFVWIKRKL